MKPKRPFELVPGNLLKRFPGGFGHVGHPVKTLVITHKSAGFKSVRLTRSFVVTPTGFGLCHPDGA